MKKIIYLVLLFSFTLTGCSNEGDSEEDHIYKVRYVDLSELAIYAGSGSGPVKVQHNILKRTELARHYFGGLYNHRIHDGLSILFNGDLITYEYTASSQAVRKIVSKYEYRNDSLFAIRTDGSYLFAAIGNHRDSLYRQSSLALYPYTTLDGKERDTVVVSDKPFDYKKDLALLPLTKYTSLDDMKTSGDTIVWCNVHYLFQ
jgi:hypothetical protein